MKSLRISRVQDLNFGRHAGRDFEGFDSPFVVVHGPNESGKSTLAEFLLWAIGGPWRSFAHNTEAFRRGGDPKLYGRLTGTFDGDPFDIEARFELKNKGKPGDLRRGHFGSFAVDSAKIAERLGGLTDEHYELIYRLHGASLGATGSAKSFSDLFSSFALGSTSAVVSPRRSLDEIVKKSSLANKKVGDLETELQRLDKLIKEAKRAPESEAQIEIELRGIEERIAELSSTLTRHSERKSLLERVKTGFDHLAELRRAEHHLAGLAEISDAWEIVASNADEIRSVVERIDQVRPEAEVMSASASRHLTDCGLVRSDLDGRTLTPAERVELSQACSSVIDARARRDEALAATEQLEEQLSAAEAEHVRRVSELGISPNQLADLGALSPALASLESTVERWVEEANRAIGAEAELDGERARRRSAESRTGTATTTVATTTPVSTIVALVAVGVSGIVHWAAGLAVAVVAAVWILSTRARVGRSEASVDPTGSDVALADLERRAAEARSAADGFRKRVEGSLGTLAAFVSNPDAAKARLTQLRELASTGDEIVDISGRLAEVRARLDRAVPEVRDAEDRAAELLRPRNIPASVLNDTFDEWLARYETALSSVRASADKNAELTGLTRRFEELVSGVAGELVGLVPRAIADRVDEVRIALDERRSALRAVRDAQMRVEAADMNSTAVQEIVATHGDVSAIEAQIEQCNDEQGEAREQRDRLIEERTAKTAELLDLQGSEVLPGLLLQKGRVEEDLGDARTSAAACQLAARTLSEVIDAYERDHQDPVVATASELVSRVVPDWGSIIMTRDDKSVPVIQRDDGRGRLGEHAISDGGRALLYLGIRLAFAKQDAERRRVALPIICDDPLVHFDDSRQEAAIHLLSQVSSEHQVILFTCERATRDLAATLGASIVEM